MSNTPHELAAEFPDDLDILHQEKIRDGHFARLAEEYHLLNREIHRIESGVEAASDERAEQLKRRRLAMLDELAAMIAKARAKADQAGSAVFGD